VYAIHFGTGQSALSSGATYLPQTSRVTNTRVVVTSGGQVEQLIGGADGTVVPFNLDATAASGTRLLNWRNVPVSGD
jgi:hypothetical protein